MTDADVTGAAMTISDFAYQALPMRVRFGAGSVGSLRDELELLGLRRVLVLCSPGQRHIGESVASALGEYSVGLRAEAVVHVPVRVADSAGAAAVTSGADGCVTVGGGSAIGLGKAVALRHGMPVVAVPTTYAGSEMTSVWGLTANGRKETGRDPKVLPRSVIYDPELTVGLPVGVSVTSGINAIAHAVEALYAPDATPISSLMAEEGVRALAEALPVIVADGADVDGRRQALYGGWLCGAALGATTMSLHHSLCHVLGGTLNLPHSGTHSVVLPYVLAFNEAHAPTASAALSRALGVASSPADRLWHLARELGAPTSLAELGMDPRDIDRIVLEVTERPYGNPHPFTQDSLRDLVSAAWSGKWPLCSLAPRPSPAPDSDSRRRLPQ